MTCDFARKTILGTRRILARACMVCRSPRLWNQVIHARVNVKRRAAVDLGPDCRTALAALPAADAGARSLGVRLSRNACGGINAAPGSRPPNN